MNNTFSLLTSIALTLVPATVLAQNTNVSIQESGNSAVVIGDGTVNQRNSQSNIQNNLGFGSVTSKQQSIQRSRNEAAAIGNNNVIEQNSQQQNIQNRLGHVIKYQLKKQRDR